MSYNNFNNVRTPSSHGAHGQQYMHASPGSQVNQDGGYYHSASAPVYNGQPHAYHYSTSQALPHPSHYMSSIPPSQPPSSQQSGGGDDRSSKRVRTREPGQAQTYPAYAMPPQPTPQAQAATRAAADAYRQGQAPAAPAASSHPPTDLPPRAYPSGTSPYAPPKAPGRITGAQMQYLPNLEARLNRLEGAVDQYVDMRGKKALENSKLPGSQQAQGGQQQQSGSSAGQQQSSSSSGQQQSRK